MLSPEFDLPTPSSGFNSVTFTVWREVEVQDPGYDRFRLRLLGSPNRTLYSVASIGNTSGFETHTVTIPSSYDGDTVRFQFDFDTRDGLYNDHEGVYVGRFQVTACPGVAGSGASVPAGFQGGLLLESDSVSEGLPTDDDELDTEPPARG